jgi:hypothetical protein
MARKQPIELFMPPNMLKAKVGGGTGGPDMAAMKRAEEAMEELKNEFSDWIAQDVKTLTAARARYAAIPGAASRDALLRAAHDIKGQAPTYNYPLIARVAAGDPQKRNEGQRQQDRPGAMCGIGCAGG